MIKLFRPHKNFFYADEFTIETYSNSQINDLKKVDQIPIQS